MPQNKKLSIFNRLLNLAHFRRLVLLCKTQRFAFLRNCTFLYLSILGYISFFLCYGYLRKHKTLPHDIDGLHILQLKVNAGHYTPYYYVGDGQRMAFVRVGDESMPATAEQMVRLVLKGSNKTYDSLHTDYKVEDYSFTILANTFKKRTSQEWDKLALAMTLSVQQNHCKDGLT